MSGRRGVDPPRAAGRATAAPAALEEEPAAHPDDVVVRCVRAVARGHEATLPAPPAGDAWSARAVEHGVLVPVLGALRAAGHTLDPGLSRARSDAAVRALVAKADLAGVGRALDGSGVPWALVKGPLLNDLVYRRRGSRESADLDLLVGPTRLRAALTALEAVGARRLGVDWTQRTWARGSEIPLAMPSGVVLDVHWHLSNRPGPRRAFGLDTDDLLRTRRPYDLGGLTVPGLDELDTVLHVLLHGCSDGCGRLRPLLDAHQCVAWLRTLGRTPTDLAVRASQRGLTSPAWVVLTLAADTLDPALAAWADGLGPPTAWARSVAARARRPGGSPLVDPLTRRLLRYVGPTSLASARGVAGYGVGRVRRLVRGDRTYADGLAPVGLDPAFESFLERAG